LGRPVVGELDLGDALLSGRGEEKERDAALCVLHPSHFLEPAQVEEIQRRFGVADAEHRVEVLDHDFMNSVRRYSSTARRQRRIRSKGCAPPSGSRSCPTLAKTHCLPPPPSGAARRRSSCWPAPASSPPG